MDALGRNFHRLRRRIKLIDIEIGENYDFFAARKNDFYSKFSHNSTLCQGEHWKKHPLVTVLITTYKRPELLSRALDSALNQKGFSDYQILIADNEGRPIKEETPTSRVVKKYQNERIIYYRHSKEVGHRMDAAVRLAKSPWIVFLHDDDILAENHLAIMTDVIKKHKEIKFLVCDVKIVTSEKEIRENQNTNGQNYKIYKYLRDALCLGNNPAFLGALISRKHYIAIGGIPNIDTGIGDTILTGSFLHHFGLYKYSGGKPLYFYCKGEQQESCLYASDSKVRVNEYFFYKYVINKYHKLTHKIWERNIAYELFAFFKSYYEDDIYKGNVDLEFIISECGLPSDILKKGARYYITRSFFYLYGGCTRHLVNTYREKIRKSDVYIMI